MTRKEQETLAEYINKSLKHTLKTLMDGQKYTLAQIKSSDSMVYTWATENGIDMHEEAIDELVKRGAVRAQLVSKQYQLTDTGMALAKKMVEGA